ncbi:MAG: hypothetical protein CBC48_06145 [bacterium TMED88]|nr:hypothetical protein [Deltaproteobacteria bacterium]OUV34380.1 MAG: hypothetical protein CBC48_06145 [bacterium TMED88]
MRFTRAGLGLWLALGAVGASISCAHVHLESQGVAVHRLGAQELPECSRVGTARVQVLAKVLFVPRSGRRVDDELTTLARNAAGNMGGDTIVAEGPVHKGKQTFGVFQCPDR